RNITALPADHDGRFELEIQLPEMIGHAADVAGALDAMMVSKIKNGVLIEFRYHGRFAVTSCGGHMLPEGIAVPTGGRQRYRRQQPDIFDPRHQARADIPVTFTDGQLTGLRDREQLVPIL